QGGTQSNGTEGRESVAADLPRETAPWQCYHLAMLDQLDALTSRMQELVAHVRQLRAENHQLRTQLATSQSELAGLNERIAAATRRLDGLIERLPREMRETDGGNPKGTQPDGA